MAQRNMDVLARKDIAAIMHGWTKDGVLELAGHSSISRRYAGKAAIETFFNELFDRMETLKIRVTRCALANPIGLTYTNTVFVEYDIEETSRRGETIRSRNIAEFEFRRGKVIHMLEWWFDPTVLDAVWGTGGVVANARALGAAGA